LGPAGDGDHAGTGDVDQAEGLHEVDEDVELLALAGHLEDEVVVAGVDDAGAADVGDAQGLDALVAAAGLTSQSITLRQWWR